MNTQKNWLENNPVTLKFLFGLKLITLLNFHQANASVLLGIGLDLDYARKVSLSEKLTTTNLGVGAELSLSWQSDAKPLRWGLGLGYLNKLNGTGQIIHQQNADEFQNFAISPRMVFLQTNLLWGDFGVFAKAMAGDAKARIVQNRVGFNYALSNGYGAALGAQFSLFQKGNFEGSLQTSHCFIQFDDEKILGVEANSSPHAGAWTYQGTQAGVLLSYTLF